MNRNLNRAEQREADKLKKWYNILPNDKKAFIGWMIEQGVIKNENNTMAIIDECFIAAMVAELELDIGLCEKVIGKSSEFMIEAKKILEKEGKEYIMKSRNEELRTEIRKAAKTMLIENCKQSTINISDKLTKKYDLPKKELHIIVAEARKELKAQVETKDIKVNIPATDKEKEEFMKEIGMDAEKTLKSKEVISKEVEEMTDREIEKQLDSLQELKKEPELVLDKTGIRINGGVFGNATLKVRAIIIDGEFGSYEKGADGVKIGDKIYNDKSIVEEEKNATISQFAVSKKEIDTQIVALQEEIERLKSTKENIIKVEENKIKMYAELEQVFNINA